MIVKVICDLLWWFLFFGKSSDPMAVASTGPGEKSSRLRVEKVRLLVRKGKRFLDRGLDPLHGHGSILFAKIRGVKEKFKNSIKIPDDYIEEL
jgi:hypothetical protein